MNVHQVIVPRENVAREGGVRVFDLTDKCWKTVAAPDAREMVAVGSGAWSEPKEAPRGRRRSSGGSEDEQGADRA